MSDVRIIFNSNIKMSPGKLAAQAVHAALNAYGIEHGRVVVLGGSVTKVKECEHVIADAGLTELSPGTVTAGATLESDGEHPRQSVTMTAEQYAKFSALSPEDQMAYFAGNRNL